MNSMMPELVNPGSFADFSARFNIGGPHAMYRYELARAAYQDGLAEARGVTVEELHDQAVLPIAGQAVEVKLVPEAAAEETWVPERQYPWFEQPHDIAF